MNGLRRFLSRKVEYPFPYQRALADLAMLVTGIYVGYLIDFLRTWNHEREVWIWGIIGLAICFAATINYACSKRVKDEPEGDLE